MRAMRVTRATRVTRASWAKTGSSARMVTREKLAEKAASVESV
jgi:hypothetical protein